MSTQQYLKINRIALIVALALTGNASLAESGKEPDGDASPRLLKLAHESEAGNGQALASFWKELDGKAPLVESIAGNPRHRRVTFVWRGSNETTRVTMIRGLPGANLLKPLRRLADTDLWYRTEIHSTEARFQYVFQINGPETLPMEIAPSWKPCSRIHRDPIRSTRISMVARHTSNCQTLLHSHG